MNVLITGGAGFVGSHLAEHLLRGSAQRVFVLDNLSTGVRENVAFLENDALEFVQGSVSDEALLQDLVSRCDAVYHLAASVGVRRVLEEPVETLEVNVLGTHCVLKACAHFKRPILIASTSEVYGKSADVPFREDGDALLGSTQKSRWSYACSKMLDEFWALAYAREFGLPVVVARLFNTVGPRQSGRYGMVVPSFVRAALTGEPLQVHGDGTQSRCFTHVRDAVRALSTLLQTPQARGEIVNVGGREEVSIRALAERIVALTESRSRVQCVPYEQAFGAHLGFEDMQRRVPDTSKLRRIVGFAPETSLDDILRDVISYEREAMTVSA